MSFHTPQARKKRVRQIAKVAPGIVTAGMAGVIAFNALGGVGAPSVDPSVTNVGQTTHAAHTLEFTPDYGVPGFLDYDTGDYEDPDFEVPIVDTSAEAGPVASKDVVKLTPEINYTPILGSDYQSPVQSEPLTPQAQYIMDTWHTATSGLDNEYGAGSGVTQQSGDYLSSQGYSNSQIAEAAQQAGAERDAQGIIEGHIYIGTVDLSVGETKVYDDPRETRWAGIDEPGIPTEPILSSEWKIVGAEGTTSMSGAQLTEYDNALVKQLIDNHRVSQAEAGRVDAERPVWWGIEESSGHTPESAPFLEIPNYTPPTEETILRTFQYGGPPTEVWPIHSSIGEIQNPDTRDNIPIPDVPQIVEVPTAQPALLEITPEGIDHLGELSSSSDNSRTQNEDRKTLRLFNTIGSIPQGDPLIKPMQATIHRLQEAQLLGPSDGGIEI